MRKQVYMLTNTQWLRLMMQSFAVRGMDIRGRRWAASCNGHWIHSVSRRKGMSYCYIVFKPVKFSKPG